jgi:hypothetical protein
MTLSTTHDTIVDPQTRGLFTAFSTHARGRFYQVPGQHCVCRPTLAPRPRALASVKIRRRQFNQPRKTRH